MAETQSAPSSEERYQTRWEAEDLGRRDGENDVTWLARLRAHFLDPTTLSEAVAAARAEGVREGLERAATAAENLASKSRLIESWWCETSAKSAAACIRALIPAPPTTPGGRTDG